MYTDRSYARLDSPEPLPEPRIIRFPLIPLRPRRGHCSLCAGHGWRQVFDADTGLAKAICLGCRGRSTTGYFVLHLVTDTFTRELNYDSRNLCAAVDRLARLASHVSGRCSLARPVLEVRVVYRSHDSDWRAADGSASEVVASIPIARMPRKAA